MYKHLLFHSTVFFLLCLGSSFCSFSGNNKKPAISQKVSQDSDTHDNKDDIYPAITTTISNTNTSTVKTNDGGISNDDGFSDHEDVNQLLDDTNTMPQWLCPSITQCESVNDNCHDYIPPCESFSDTFCEGCSDNSCVPQSDDTKSSCYCDTQSFVRDITIIGQKKTGFTKENCIPTGWQGYDKHVDGSDFTCDNNYLHPLVSKQIVGPPFLYRDNIFSGVSPNRFGIEIKFRFFIYTPMENYAFGLFNGGAFDGSRSKTSTLKDNNRMVLGIATADNGNGKKITMLPKTGFHEKELTLYNVDASMIQQGNNGTEKNNETWYVARFAFDKQAEEYYVWFFENDIPTIKFYAHKKIKADRIPNGIILGNSYLLNTGAGEIDFWTRADIEYVMTFDWEPKCQ